MDDPCIPELSTQQRAGLALWLVLQRPMTTMAIARRLGMKRHACWIMLNKLAGPTPIRYDYKLRCWLSSDWKLVFIHKGEDDMTPE